MAAGKWPKATKNNPCPACGHDRRCHIRDDGRAGRCYWPGESRLTDGSWKEEQQDATGVYRLWFLDAAAPSSAAPQPPTPSRATSGQIDRVYSRLLELCPIGPKAAEELARERGLELEQVTRLRFGRLPRPADCSRVLGQLETEFGEELLLGVPGFFAGKGGKLSYQARGPGLIIPHFDAEAIVALQIRPDKTTGSKYYWFSSGGKGGPSVQAPYIAGDAGTTGLVVVTEGAFKALALAKQLKTMAVGLPGVSSIEPALELLRNVAAREVLLAFDADHAEKKPDGKKNMVFASLRATVDRLREAGYEVGLTLWNRGDTYVEGETPKGADDALRAGAELFELRGSDVDTYLTKVATTLGQLPPKKNETEENPVSTYRRLRAFVGTKFAFFSENGTAYLASRDGTACDLNGQDAEEKLLLALEGSGGGDPPSPEMRKQILVSKRAEARNFGPFAQVHRRLAHFRGRHYLDLCRHDGKIVEMTAEGWKIVDSPPGLYWRRKVVGNGRAELPAALPDPIPGGDVMLLGEVLNARGTVLKFLIAFLVGILRTEFSYPLLVFEGRAGSAKSAAARILKYMVDPTSISSLIGDMPKSKEDVAVNCNAAHLVCYDNVDRIKPEMSDFLCQVATGSSIKKRALYTAGDEVELTVKNPVIISGIEGIVDRADLASRAALVTLEPIKDSERREEREVWAIAKRIRPQVLGGILDAFCAGLANLDKTPLPQVRNVDFARFMLASETGLPWPSGEATEYLSTSRNELYEQALWKDRVALAVIDLQERAGTWSGTMMDLLATLQPPSAYGEDFWPTTGHKLTRRITQAAPLLEYKGVSVTKGARSSRGPIFTISGIAKAPADAVSAAQSLLFQ